MSKINLTPIFIIIIAALAFLTDRYHSNATEYKKQRDDKVNELNMANATITDMTTRQRDVAALDAKYTKDLADAKKQLDDLQRCVRDGKCGLRVNAKCPANGAAGTGSLGDASGPRLTDSAERDYFRLRERIERARSQIAGLQDYIRRACLTE